MLQSVKPKYPAEIKAASTRIAERNEDCRRPAREQHLHLLKRYPFMRDCKRKRAVSALRYTLFLKRLQTSALRYTLF